MKNENIDESALTGALMKSGLALGAGGITTKAIVDKLSSHIGNKEAPEALKKAVSLFSGEAVEENTANAIMKSGQNAGKIMGGTLAAGGLYALKKLKDNVQGTVEDISQNQDQFTTATQNILGENIYVIEPKELVEAMFDLPDKPMGYKERIQENSFNNLNKYIVRMK